MSKQQKPLDGLSVELSAEQLQHIAEQEPEMAQALHLLIGQIAGTYSDKYADGIKCGIDTKPMLYNREKGDHLNVYQVQRYLQRYLTTGNEKSHLLVDMLKAGHYLMFEVVRRIKTDEELQLVEPRK